MNTNAENRYAVDLEHLDRTGVALVGGKAANLGELTTIDGVVVPAGFCVTTGAYVAAVAAAGVDDLLERLDLTPDDDLDTIGPLAADIRAALESVPMPPEVAADITDALARFGDHTLAVRSSATVEDSPTASYAGLHDSYLHVDPAGVIDRVRCCWASVFTERAVAYRNRGGVDCRSVGMAVIVQEMVSADSAGVMFTADPSSSNRRTVVIEAVSGLGDSLVSGRTNTVPYRVCDARIVGTGGPEALLSDEQIVAMAQLGQRIEHHFGLPQDIEWCLVGDQLHIVQTRPITTLFPVPTADDDAKHVYVSVGHNQMMTDAMTPLGLSVWQMTTPAQMVEAGSRLFVDVTARLATQTGRDALLELFGRGDPLLRDALEVVIQRDGFLPPVSDDPTGGPLSGPLPADGDPIDTDPELVTALIAKTTASIDLARSEIAETNGVGLFDFIAADIGELRARLFDPASHKATMAGIEATWWINDHIAAWLDEPNAADTLTQSAPNNITSQMGLALLDVADIVRPHPDVVDYLQHAAANRDDGFLDEFTACDGGPEARAAIEDYLDRYGMRCVGEIDITRTRWAEQPSRLLPPLLANVDNFEPGEARRRFEAGRQTAEAATRDLLDRLRGLPDGAAKADETEAMINRLRTFIGYREYPKYGMIIRYHLYKQALLREADRLVREGVVTMPEDVYFLRFDEFRETVRTGTADTALIEVRRDAHRHHWSLRPPRVTTSDGDAHNGHYRRHNIANGALPGLGVSGGVVEGRARVVSDLVDARLEPGDILVTTHTDPSWSPLFVTAAGLVTEVGGLMTHGAVVAREYGLPAVVAVDNATTRIHDGQTIRVDGTSGYVEVIA